MNQNEHALYLRLARARSCLRGGCSGGKGNSFAERSADRISSTSTPQFGFFPFDFPVETHSENAAACSGAHFCERHSRSVVAREAQARSASFEEEEEVEVEEGEEVDSPLLEEFAAMQAA